MVQSSLACARTVSLWVVLCSAGGGEDRSSGCSPGAPLGRCVRTWTVVGTVPAARVSRFAGLGDGRGCLRWLLGSCPVGGHRFSESHWRPLGAQFMSVGKLCGSFCSGASRQSEVGGEQGRWVTGSRPIASDQPSGARWPSRPCTRWQGSPDRGLLTSTWSSSRCRLDFGWREPSVP